MWLYSFGVSTEHLRCATSSLHFDCRFKPFLNSWDWSPCRPLPSLLNFALCKGKYNSALGGENVTNFQILEGSFCVTQTGPYPVPEVPATLAFLILRSVISTQQVHHALFGFTVLGPRSRKLKKCVGHTQPESWNIRRDHLVCCSISEEHCFNMMSYCIAVLVGRKICHNGNLSFWLNLHLYIGYLDIPSFRVSVQFFGLFSIWLSLLICRISYIFCRQILWWVHALQKSSTHWLVFALLFF